MPKITTKAQKTSKPKSTSSEKPKSQQSAAVPRIKSKQGGRTQTVSEDKRRAMIAEAAYFRSLARTSAEGSEQEDWLLAEQEINHHLAAPQSA